MVKKSLPLIPTLSHIVTNMSIARQRFGKDSLEAGIMEPELTSIAEQRFGNQVPAAMNSNERAHLLGSRIDTCFMATAKTE
jgi:hypothetical protein